jgi:flagellar FliL protein
MEDLIARQLTDPHRHHPGDPATERQKPDAPEAAMAEEENKEDGDELEEASGGGSKLNVILVALVAINSLLTTGVLAVTLLKEPPPPPAPADGKQGEAAEGEDGEEAAAEGEEGEVGEDGEVVPRKKAIRGPIEKLDDIVIQLRNPEFDRFARIGFEVELGDEEDLEFLKAYKPRLRDTFIAWLSDRTYEELRGSRGLAMVKKKLTEKADEILPGGRIKALYITSFVVQ